MKCFRFVPLLLLIAATASAQTEPILYYSFDNGTTSYLAGESLGDLSPSGYDGTIAGGLIRSTGAFGNSAQFGAGRTVDVGVPLFSTTDATQPYTISTWVRTDTETSMAILSQYQSGNAARTGLEMNRDGTGRPQWWTGGTVNAQSQTDVRDSQWHHVVFVKDASQDVTIYIDGQVDTSSTYSNTHTSAFPNVNTLIGGYTPAVYNYGGSLDELRVYDEVLSASQIENLYKYNALDVPTTNLLQVDFGGNNYGINQVVQDEWRGVSQNSGSALAASRTVTYAGADLTVSVDDDWDEGPGWQTRSTYTTLAHPLSDVAQDYVYSWSNQSLYLTLGGLPAGEHYLRTYHHDSYRDYGGSQSITLTDANGAGQVVASYVATSSGGAGAESGIDDPAPGKIASVPIKIVSDGTSDVVLEISSATAPCYLNGLELTDSLPGDVKVDFQFDGAATQNGFQPFAHTSASHERAQSMWYFSELGRRGSVEVTYDSSAAVAPRNRAAGFGAQADLTRDMLSATGDLTVSLGNLKPGTYTVTTYHHDPDVTPGSIDIAVIDGGGERTVASGLAQTGGAADPASAQFSVTANGLLPVEIEMTGSTVVNNGIEVQYESGTPSSDPTPVKVFLIGGQSNADGRAQASDLPAELQAKAGIPTYHEGEWHYLEGGLVAKADDLFGPEVTFGRAMGTGCPDEMIVLVKYAVGGTDIAEDWAPGEPGGPQYEGFMDTVEGALASLEGDYIAEIGGMIWMQGEADALDATKAAAYEQNLTSLIATFRDELDTPDMPFVIGQISDSSTWTYGDTVQAAQAAVAGADPNTSMITTTDLPLLSDGIHYNAGGTMTLGTRFANALLDLIGGATLEGDLNGDGAVSSADLDIVRGNWGRTVPVGALDQGDANADGLVNSGDLDIIRANWGQTSAATVPEPGVLAMMVGLLGVLLLGRGNRS